MSFKVFLDFIYLFLFGRNKFFDNNYFKQLFLNSNLFQIISFINFKLFYNNKCYFGNYLKADQFHSNDRKKDFINIIKNFLQNNNIKKANYLEIGSYAGSSAITACDYFSKESIDFRCVCIDLWSVAHTQTSLEGNWYNKRFNEWSVSQKSKNLFLHNVKNSKHNIKFYQMDINEFISREYNNLDLEFNIFYIDASHVYKDVLNDIKGCLHVINKNKKEKTVLIFGDDHDLFYREVEDYKPSYLDIDCIRSSKIGARFHPGVSKAVFDTFKYDYEVANHFWYKIVTL
jgi:hypothetical protein